MLSILPISNAACWNCHDGTNRGSRFLCIRQQLRPAAGPILRAASAHSRRPAFIPRNHLVEEAISAAVNDGYFPPFESLLTVLSMPYEDQPAFGPNS